MNPTGSTARPLERRSAVHIVPPDAHGLWQQSREGGWLWVGPEITPTPGADIIDCLYSVNNRVDYPEVYGVRWDTLDPGHMARISEFCTSVEGIDFAADFFLVESSNGLTRFYDRRHKTLRDFIACGVLMPWYTKLVWKESVRILRSYHRDFCEPCGRPKVECYAERSPMVYRHADRRPLHRAPCLAAIGVGDRFGYRTVISVEYGTTVAMQCDCGVLTEGLQPYQAVNTVRCAGLGRRSVRGPISGELNPSHSLSVWEWCLRTGSFPVFEAPGSVAGSSTDSRVSSPVVSPVVGSTLHRLYGWPEVLGGP